MERREGDGLELGRDIKEERGIEIERLDLFMGILAEVPLRSTAGWILEHGYGSHDPVELIEPKRVCAT